MNDLEIDNINKIEKIKRLYKIFNLDLEFLATYIILYKTLGMHKDLAMDAMEVIYYRVNILNEKFDYNNYIIDNIKKIPTIPEVAKLSEKNIEFLNDISSFTRISMSKK